MGGKFAVVACALALAACATENDERDAMGSRLEQPPPGTKRPAPVAAGDIAIVGQDVANGILELPPVASASVPPLVRFNGVTSIINPPIDTDPYTELLRDRLLLLTRQKLRFVEHTLPPYVPPSKRKHAAVSSDSGAEYEVLAELRGRAEADSYKIQVEFVAIGSGQVLFNETYRIAKEAEAQPDMDAYTSPQASPPPERPQPDRNSESRTPGTPAPGYYDPSPPATKSSGDNGVL